LALFPLVTPWQFRLRIMEGSDFTVCYIQKRRGWRRMDGI